MKQQVAFSFIFSFFFSAQTSFAAKIIPLDTIAQSTSSTVAIGPHRFLVKQGSTSQDAQVELFTGAATASENNAYAVAKISKELTTTSDSRSQFAMPLAPPSTAVNNNTVSNPLYGAKIDHLTTTLGDPVVIKNGENFLYFFEQVNLQAPNLQKITPLDSDGKEAGTVIALEGTNKKGKLTFAAVTANGTSSFGTGNSGILLAGIQPEKDIFTSTVHNNKKAIALNGSTDSIKITSDVTLSGNVVALHWNNVLQRLYIGLQATAGSGGSDGARSIIVGRITGDDDSKNISLEFSPFAPSAVFTANNEIVGTKQAGATVTAYKLSSMETSTRLHYLIVAGGNGTLSQTGNTIYALPLVTDTRNIDENKATFGTLASASDTPIATFGDGVNQLAERFFSTRATQTSDLLTTTSTAAQVGQGALPIAATTQINDLWVAGDSVYVAVGTATDATNEAGIYSSQALFDNKGKIVNWTKWQHASGNTQQTFGLAVDQRNAELWTLEGSSSTAVTSIKHTAWGEGNKDGLLGGTSTDNSVGLVAQLVTVFGGEEGGITSLENITTDHPATSNLSFLVAAGTTKVALIRTAAHDGTRLIPDTGDFQTNAASSNDGSLPTAASTAKLVTISGGDLATIGPLSSATIATNSSTGHSWLVAGGSNGVVILRTTGGTCWTTALSDLSNSTSGIAFRSFGSYRFVRKVYSDGTYLYIVTDKTVDRVELTPANISSASPTVTSVATQTTVGATPFVFFNDFLASGDLALLATTRGLFRIGDGKSIATITSSADAQWTELAVPEGFGNDAQLLPVTGNGLPTDLHNDGNLYVVSSYRGALRTGVYRYHVKVNGSVSSTTIQQLPDLYVQGQLSSFIDFLSFRDHFGTDGSYLLSAQSTDRATTRFAASLGHGIKSGVPFTKNAEKKLALAIADNNTLFTGFTKIAPQGTWSTTGDFGIRVSE